MDIAGLFPRNRRNIVVEGSLIDDEEMQILAVGLREQEFHDRKNNASRQCAAVQNNISEIVQRNSGDGLNCLPTADDGIVRSEDIHFTDCATIYLTRQFLQILIRALT